MVSAFRHLGIKPSHWAWLILAARSPVDSKLYYFVEKSLPFGSSISCAHFQEFSTSIAWIVRFRTKRDLVNYLDDYLFVALLKLFCDSQIDTFLEICKSVNFPVSLEKTFWETTRLTFLGMLLDTVNQVVAIPVEKIDKAKSMLNYALSKRSGKLTLHELQRICGFLNFLCRCIVPGRAFTRRLYAATASRGARLKSHHHIRINSEMKLDMRVWQSFLDKPMAFCRPFMDFSKIWTATELQFYTDSSG